MPDDGLRQRLRALFSATDDEGEAAVEALIAERGRELEQRTVQLAATIADLERREERARELRVAVEDMLRHGSAELDDRHAELNALAQELGAREDAVATAERDVADRRRELGAVELHRAAIERREAALAEREAALERIAADLQTRELRLADLERAERELAARETELAAAHERLARDDDAVEHTGREDAAAHVVFAAGDRYRLAEREGPPPAPGADIELDGERFLVVRLGPSPLPGDRRWCAFVERAPEHHAGLQPDAPDRPETRAHDQPVAPA